MFYGEPSVDAFVAELAGELCGVAKGNVLLARHLGHVVEEDGDAGLGACGDGNHAEHDNGQSGSQMVESRVAHSGTGW